MSFSIYTNPGPPVTFRPSGGGGTGTLVNFNIAALSASVGHLSAQFDLGVGPRPFLYEWRAKITLDNGVNIGENLILKVCSSDGSIADGTFSTADQSVASIDLFRNLQFMGSLELDNPQTVTVLQGSGIVQIYGRYVQLAIWNNTTTNIKSTTSASKVILTPVPDYGI